MAFISRTKTKKWVWKADKGVALKVRSESENSKGLQGGGWGSLHSDPVYAILKKKKSCGRQRVI